ncbi:hypothetical protein V8C40DRAFT_242616 [Trichoderma camerunense]
MMYVGELFDGSVALVWGFNLCLLFVSADIRHSERDMPCIVVLQMMLTLPPLWTRFRLVGCYSSRAPSCNCQMPESYREIFQCHLPRERQ